MQGKNLKYIFETTNLQQQRTGRRKFHHLGVMDAQHHNLCNRNKAGSCEIEIRQSRLEIILLERQDNINFFIFWNILLQRNVKVLCDLTALQVCFHLNINAKPCLGFGSVFSLYTSIIEAKFEYTMYSMPTSPF